MQADMKAYKKLVVLEQHPSAAAAGAAKHRHPLLMSS
jgi:hypothetical protein